MEYDSRIEMHEPMIFPFGQDVRMLTPDPPRGLSGKSIPSERGVGQGLLRRVAGNEGVSEATKAEATRQVIDFAETINRCLLWRNLGNSISLASYSGSPLEVLDPTIPSTAAAEGEPNNPIGPAPYLEEINKGKGWERRRKGNAACQVFGFQNSQAVNADIQYI